MIPGMSAPAVPPEAYRGFRIDTQRRFRCATRKKGESKPLKSKTPT